MSISSCPCFTGHRVTLYPVTASAFSIPWILDIEWFCACIAKPYTGWSEETPGGGGARVHPGISRNTLPISMAYSWAAGSAFNKYVTITLVLGNPLITANICFRWSNVRCRPARLTSSSAVFCSASLASALNSATRCSDISSILHGYARRR
jgi:hypothetical protein